MKRIIDRPEYLNNLISYKDKNIIKVITGIRRCGKSTLFDLYCDYLQKNGVSDEDMIRINLEDLKYSHITNYLELYDLIESKLKNNKMNYIFVDEVQNIPDFQKAIDSLFIKENCDIYITGSNAFLLSGELATLLSGRYVEIKMLPLSFKEYRSAFKEETNLERLYDRYIHNSAFPFTLELSKSRDISQYLNSVYDSVVLKDIVSRKNLSKIDQLESIIRFMFDNIGNLVSMKKIADTMTSSGRKISVHTVESYLSALEDSYIMYKIGRYDVKGKQYLKTGYKYYVCDIGLRYNLLGDKKIDEGHILENVVFLELLRRGKEVYIGKVDRKECDFICSSVEGREYYQVAYTLRGNDGKILERELDPLFSINDHNPKYLLTMDIGSLISHNGIKQVNVLDWLLGEE